MNGWRPSKASVAAYLCLGALALATQAWGECVEPRYIAQPLQPGIDHLGITLDTDQAGYHSSRKVSAGAQAGYIKDTTTTRGYYHVTASAEADDYSQYYYPAAGVSHAMYVDPVPYTLAGGTPVVSATAAPAAPVNTTVSTTAGATVTATVTEVTGTTNATSNRTDAAVGLKMAALVAANGTSTLLSGPCMVEVNFTLCSSVGKTETFHNLKQKYAAPGHLPKLQVVARKNNNASYFAGEYGCNCKTEFTILASKNVSTVEDAEYYRKNLKQFFQEFVTVDDKLVCMNYKDPVSVGSGCPAAATAPTAGPAHSPPTPPPSRASASASAASTGGSASASATSTGGAASSSAQSSGGACGASLAVRVCVDSRAAFMAELRVEERRLAAAAGLKRRAFRKHLKFTQVDGDGLCPHNTQAIRVDIDIPASGPATHGDLAQSVQSIGALLVGQKLPSVRGGDEVSKAVAGCS